MKLVRSAPLDGEWLAMGYEKDKKPILPHRQFQTGRVPAVPEV